MTFSVKTALEEQHGSSTLLGICPMTEEIVEAAMLEAAETGFTPMFIATPRQVDADRGYTGWSQSELVDFAEQCADQYDYDGPYILARDHGGPYQSTRDRDEPDVRLEDAMAYAKELFFEDLAAGFDILHVDATEDARVEGGLDLEEVARRTATLIRSIETERKREGYEEVYYEVGTEEIHGGMTESDDFERYIELLGSKLGKEHADVMDRVLFIVGQVGTTMRIDMTNQFDPEKANSLVSIASAHDLFLKVHYTDWLDTNILEQFPEIGIGAANVGPEFAAAIVESLAELEEEETRALKAEDDLGKRSEFMTTFRDVAVAKAPWEKFAPEDLEEDEELASFAESNRDNIALCVGRYVLTEPDVVDAREALYTNVREHTNIDPHQFLVENVRETIHRYVDAFDLAANSP